MTKRTSMAIKVEPLIGKKPAGCETLKRSDGPWLAVLYRGPAGLRRGIVQKCSNAFSEAGCLTHEGWYLPPEHLWLVSRNHSSRQSARDRVKQWIHCGV